MSTQKARELSRLHDDNHRLFHFHNLKHHQMGLPKFQNLPLNLSDQKLPEVKVLTDDQHLPPNSQPENSPPWDFELRGQKKLIYPGILLAKRKTSP
ncbi:hypothetical protein MJO29_013225 [Puccinia striiformis f. sp. tritici]|nr:hypothetical protein MJO29_013225 [Puccinia striiformis f. sp. tritici]